MPESNFTNTPVNTPWQINLNKQTIAQAQKNKEKKTKIIL